MNPSLISAASNHTEGPVNYRIFDVTAIARHGRFGAVGYASKTLTARFTNAP